MSNSSHQRAAILTINDNHLQQAAEFLRSGGLVAFPTETVYGLGGNIFHEQALRNIFFTKKRPSHNPLIVHIAQPCADKELFLVSSEERKIITALTDAFWPGPLTIVAQAANTVSRLVTAGSHDVAVRCPRHPVAQQLLKLVEFPLAAPSANLFSRTSPTQAGHVFADFSQEDILILDGGQAMVGIESTIIKITGQEARILRRGSITPGEIDAVLAPYGVRTQVFDTFHHLQSQKITAPGQFLKHYAPRLPAYIFSPKKPDGLQQAAYPMSACIVIDFARMMFPLAKRAMLYRSLSDVDQVCDAMANLFNFLHETATVNGAQAIILPDFDLLARERFSLLEQEVLQALADRIYRSAAGKFAAVTDDGSVVELY